MLASDQYPDAFHLQEAHRRIANVVVYGTVEEIDDGKYEARVQVGKLRTGWLPIATQRCGEDRQFWLPTQGEQVVVVSMCGNLDQGVIIGSFSRGRFPVPETKGKNLAIYRDGTRIEYDTRSHTLNIVAGDGGINIKAPRGINIIGNITVQGTVTATCVISGCG